MSPPNPDKYSKAVGLKVSEEEHQQLKMLATKKKKTIKTIIFEALDKVFPGWRKEETKKD